MANDIVSAILGSNPLTITDEYTGDTKYPNLKVESVEIGFISESAEYPLTDQITGDQSQIEQKISNDLAANKVIHPSTVRIKGYLDDIVVVTELIADFLDNTKTFSVSSKSIITDSMGMLRCELVQSSEVLSATEVTIEFEQAIPWEKYEYDPENKADEGTYGSHVDAGETLLDSAKDLYNKVADAL